MDFEWDEAKNQKNIEKHKLSFMEAARIFLGPNPVLSYDTTREESGERRTLTLGKLEGEEIVLIAVVHTDRKGVIRLISARRASKKEKRMFYEYCKSKE